MKLEWKRIWNQISVRSMFFLCMAVMLLLFTSQQIQKSQTDAEGNEVQGEEMSSERYHKEYQKKIAGIVKEADSMAEISIFAQKDSYVDRNRTKTKNDYGKLYHVEITQGRNQLFTSLLTEKYWTILVLAFGMFLAYKVPYPENSSMEIITHSCQKGRKVLRRRHLLLVLGFSAVTGSILYLLNLLMGFFLYGVDSSWLRSIQSVPECWSCTMQVSMAGALVLDFVIGLLGVMAGICTGWALMKRFGTKIGLFLWAFLYGIGYVNFCFVAQDSNLNLLRSLNFYQILFPKNIFTTYQNYNVAGYPFGQAVIQFVFSLAVFTAGSLYVVYKNTREKKNHKKLFKIKRIWKRPFTGLGRMECKEILWHQKGCWILAFAMLLVYVLSLQNQVSYTAPQRAMNEFYETYGGKITEKTYEEVEKLKEEYSQLLEENKELKEKYQRKELSRDEYEVERFFLVKEIERASMVVELSAKIERLKKYQEKGYQVELVNERGYDKLLEKGLKRKLEVVVQIMVLFLLLIGYFKRFSKKNWRYMVRATRDGRDIFFLKRMLVFTGILALAMALLYGVDFYNIYRMYPMEHFTAPIHSLQLAENEIGNYPIWLYLVIIYLGKIALWCGIGMICYSAGYFAVIGKSFREEIRKDEAGD